MCERYWEVALYILMILEIYSKEYGLVILVLFIYYSW